MSTGCCWEFIKRYVDGMLLWQGAGYRVTDGAVEKLSDPTYQLALCVFFSLWGQTLTNGISNGLVEQGYAAHV
jgi:hypothetical protein